MTCSSGPPCWPGKTAESIFFAYSSLQRMIPARGPPRVLWVVVVTTSAPCSTGLAWMPAATSPAKWAMSTISSAPTSSAISRKRAKSSCARVGRPAGQQHLRPALTGDPCDLVHVDQAALAVDLVGGDVIEPARDIDLHAVGQVPAVCKGEAHDRVAWLQQGVVDGRVGLRARMRLDVGVLGAEQRLGAVDRQLLGDVDPLAAAVVAPARDSPRRTCWSGPTPGTRARRGERSSPRRSSPACAADGPARRSAHRRSRGPPRRAGG